MTENSRMMKGKEKDSSFIVVGLGFLDPSLSVHLNEASVCCRLLGLWLWASAQSSPRGPAPGTG